MTNIYQFLTDRINVTECINFFQRWAGRGGVGRELIDAVFK